MPSCKALQPQLCLYTTQGDFVCTKQSFGVPTNQALFQPTIQHPTPKK